MKTISSLLLAWTLAATSPVEARDCQPSTPGYVSWFFSDACVLALQSTSTQFQMKANYTKARVNNGTDTGELKTPGINTTIETVHNEVQKKLDDAINDIGGSRVLWYVPTVNLRWRVVATASPDVNISKELKRNSGEGSPTFSLYETTPESMLTARKRCDDLLANLPAKVLKWWNEFHVTTNGLTCVPQVQPLDISTWAGPLTKLALELKNKWLVASDMDDAQILAVKYANNPATIPSSLSKESQNTIKKLTQELDSIRTIEINGTMQASVMVNKQEYNLGNIIGSFSWIAALFALALWLQRRNTQNRNIYVG